MSGKKSAGTGILLIVTVLAWVLGGCSAARLDALAQDSGSLAGSGTPPADFTDTPFPLPPSPSATLTPTETPVPSPTLTATPTLHPMNILAARQTEYPGSAITIEETLTAAVGYQRYIAWYESEGLKIYGLLTIPNGDPPPGGWPAIVFNHGYIPPDQYRSTERYIAYVDGFARSGYAVYRIDYRGHDRSDGAASGAYGSPGYTVDVLNAVTALQQYPGINPQKIGMWGHSMGGYLTLRAMVISKDIKAGVIWAGVVAPYADMMCCWRTPAPGQPTRTPDATERVRWRNSWAALYGSPAENPEFWDGISANHFLSEISGPLQLHHGTADTDVPVAFSRNLYQQMADAGLPVEYYEYEGDNHNLQRYFSQAMQRSIDFFDLYLKDAP